MFLHVQTPPESVLFISVFTIKFIWSPSKVLTAFLSTSDLKRRWHETEWIGARKLFTTLN
ncbi:MAG: hypothetical protein C4527_10930 [Candidatus Omnitrophota bacterium]|nr:MAG: hypothetical protein C4527_10930 [Candidatus Omnitrophota bacterium]